MTSTARFEGERLRVARLAKGMTQAALGLKVGKHKSHISRYENNESRPGAESLGELAGALGVGVEALFSETKRNGSNGRHGKGESARAGAGAQAEKQGAVRHAAGGK